jgi:hypothetical protein
LRVLCKECKNADGAIRERVVRSHFSIGRSSRSLCRAESVAAEDGCPASHSRRGTLIPSSFHSGGAHVVSQSVPQGVHFD